jgi:hypothetical protein
MTAEVAARTDGQRAALTTRAILQFARRKIDTLLEVGRYFGGATSFATAAVIVGMPAVCETSPVIVTL